MQPTSLAVFTEETTWNGTLFRTEYLETIDFASFSPVQQVQALCFNEPNSLVIYKDIEGGYGLPGGSVELGESLEQALRREIKEEIAAELTSYAPLLLLKVTNLSSGAEGYQARYWATCKLNPGPVDDPAKKAISRHIVNSEELQNYLGWGKKIELYLRRCCLVAPELLPK